MNNRIQLSILLGLVAGVPIAALGEVPTAERQFLNCKTGPTTKTYGKTQWLVYSCDDGRSVAIITAPGNPGTPFYFVFRYTGKGYRLEGEGTGSKTVTDAAFEELKSLSERDIAHLVKETKPR
jgi:hypothetical protein